MAQCYYTREHEWIEIQPDNQARIGITAYAVEQLGDIVFVELPDIDSEITAQQECAVVESVKSASEIYAPVNGKVLEKNSHVEEDPSLLNQDSSTWLMVIELTQPSELSSLMNEESYSSYVDSLKL